MKVNSIGLIGFAVSAASCVAVPAAAQEAVAPPANSTPAEPPVNLINVAELSYNPTRDTYDEWREFPGSWQTDFTLTVDATGYPVRCQPFRKDLDRKTATTLCLDLLDYAEIRLLRGFSTGGRDAIIGVSKEPFERLPGVGENSSPFTFRLAELGASNYITYEPIRADEQPQLSADQARLIDRPKKRQYPIFASRYGYEGTVRVLNTISSDGSIIGCRPLESSGYAILDNAACAHMLEKARFKLQLDDDATQGPFFKTLSFTWKLPKK